MEIAFIGASQSTLLSIALWTDWKSPIMDGGWGLAGSGKNTKVDSSNSVDQKVLGIL